MLREVQDAPQRDLVLLWLYRVSGRRVYLLLLDTVEVL